MEQAKSELKLPKEMNMPHSYESFLRYCMDDSWNFSELDNHEQHLVHLELQLYAIKNANLKISPPKCKIATTSVMVLGLQMNTKNAELYISQKKASSILSWPKPSSLYEVQSRLCSLLCFIKFLPSLKEISFPLKDMLCHLYEENSRKKPGLILKLY